MPLIDLTYIGTKKDVSKHLDKVAVQHIDDAELVDLKPLLGEKLYLHMSANPNETIYVALLNGSTYTYDGFQYTHPGVKRVLAEFAYARISFFGNEKSTPYGLVEKRYDDATMIHRDRAKERYKASQQIAVQLWYEVKAFLDRNRGDYEYWNCSEGVRGMLSNYKLRHIR